MLQTYIIRMKNIDLSNYEYEGQSQIEPINIIEFFKNSIICLVIGLIISSVVFLYEFYKLILLIAINWMIGRIAVIIR